MMHGIPLKPVECEKRKQQDDRVAASAMSDTSVSTLTFTDLSKLHTTGSSMVFFRVSKTCLAS